MPPKKKKQEVKGEKKKKKTSKKRKQGAGAGAKDEEEEETETKLSAKEAKRIAREKREEEEDKEEARRKAEAQKARDAECAVEREENMLNIPDRNAAAFSKDAELVVYGFLDDWTTQMHCKCADLTDAEWKQLWTIPGQPSGPGAKEECEFLHALIKKYGGENSIYIDQSLSNPVQRLVRIIDLREQEDPLD